MVRCSGLCSSCSATSPPSSATGSDPQSDNLSAKMLLGFLLCRFFLNVLILEARTIGTMTPSSDEESTSSLGHEPELPSLSLSLDDSSSCSCAVRLSRAGANQLRSSNVVSSDKSESSRSTLALSHSPRNETTASLHTTPDSQQQPPTRNHLSLLLFVLCV